MNQVTKIMSLFNQIKMLVMMILYNISASIELQITINTYMFIIKSCMYFIKFNNYMENYFKQKKQIVHAWVKIIIWELLLLLNLEYII